jgi:DNA-directed RNA polymerase subunit RPC12/RpoP
MEIERQELSCHNCKKYVQFNIDLSLDGEHEIICPNCGHIHYRVIKKGIITEARWSSSNVGMNTYVINTTQLTCTATSTFENYSTTGYTFIKTDFTTSATSDSDIFLYTSWMNTTFK